MAEVVALFSVALLVLIFPAIGWTCAQIGGWAALAREYDSSPLSSATCVRWKDLSLGWMNYSGAVTYCVGLEGLRISMIWLFRFGHPPVLIPWRAIEEVTPPSGWGPFRSAKLRIACGPRTIRAGIPPAVYELIRQHAAQQLRDA